MKELEEMGLTWGESQAKVQDRIEWQCLILCPSRIKRLCEWVSLAERKKKKENLDFTIIFCLDIEQNAIEYNF